METDYEKREYLSVGEVAAYTGMTVRQVHSLVKSNQLRAIRSGSGQYRFNMKDVEPFSKLEQSEKKKIEHALRVNNTLQNIYLHDSRDMAHVETGSVNMVVTSPPYFNAKMYSKNEKGDLGNVHDLDMWLEEISGVWREVYRVLQPGRKFFLNIMNLPVRNGKTFRTINLAGKNTDLCESLGFVFKRDIIWQKTNGVRAHFGTYPYPGGILINNMHEFILEFEKPQAKVTKKYAHVTEEQRERSKLSKEFWLELKNSDVWVIKPEKSGGNRDHVAPFPVELPERLIQAYTFEGELILDPFLGSGTTLVAASGVGRNGIGYEINKTFFQMSHDRLAGIGKPSPQAKLI